MTIIAVITGINALFWLNMMAASVAAPTVVGYFLCLGEYAAALMVSVRAGYIIPSTSLSKAVLYGIAFALIGLTMGAFWNDPQARIFPSIFRQQLPGTDPVTNAIKFIVNNCFLIYAMTAANLLMASIIMVNPLMWPFAIITFAVAVTALSLANSK